MYTPDSHNTQEVGSFQTDAHDVQVTTNRFRNGLACAGLVITTLLNQANSLGQDESHLHTANNVQVINETAQPACPPATPEAIAAVTKIFDSPKPSPSFRHIRPTPNQPPKTVRQIEDDFLETGIKKLGVTIHQFDLAKIDPVHFGKQAGSNWQLKNYLTATNKFAAQYGVDIQIATPATLSGMGGQITVPTADELKKPEFADTVYSIGEALSMTPVQEVRKDIKLNHVILTAYKEKPGDSGEYIGLAVTDGNEESVYVNGGAGIAPDVILHEESHHLDANMCGGPSVAPADPTFTRLNGHSTYGSLADSHQSEDMRLAGRGIYSFEKSDDFYKLEDAAFYAQKNDKASPACRALRKIASVKHEATRITSYGYTNVIEDKAEFGTRSMEKDGYHYTLDPQAPKIRAKMLEWLGRLYMRDPAVVKYYGFVANRPYIPLDTTFDC